MTRPPVLVIGATGILRPACLSLVRAGRQVLAVARDEQRLNDLQRVAGPLLSIRSADCSKAAAVRTALTDSQGLLVLSGALVYCPAAPAQVLEVIARATDGPLVWLQTTASAAAQSTMDELRADRMHGRGPVPVGLVTVRLGWATAPDGPPRWHTPYEASAIALQALHRITPQTLGTWDPARPLMDSDRCWSTDSHTQGSVPEPRSGDPCGTT